MNPYLSIIVSSRNDDHGGNASRRMQVSINGLLEQLEKHRIESELVLVDWNPPQDKPLLKDVLKWPHGLRYCTIRCIIVPPSIHQRYEYSNILGMHAVVAVNCGIRRARGQFILPGVIDLLYSDELMSYITTRELKENERYRVDRCDVNRNVVQCDTLKEQLAYCKKNIIKINRRIPPILRWMQGEHGLPDLHTNACGDFQLMSSHYWHLLHGYRESDIAAAYVDGLLSYASYAAGVKEVVLKNPMRIYHIDHDNRMGNRIKRTSLPFQDRLSSTPFMPAWYNGKIIPLYRMLMVSLGYKVRSSAHGIPTLDYTEYLEMCRDIVAGKRSNVFNDENWGLGQETLEEFSVATAEWDKGYEGN